MKIGSVLVVLLLLLPLVAFAQSPAPTPVPAQQPSPMYKSRAPEAQPSPAYLEDVQEPMPRQPQPPQPPQPPQRDLGKWWKNSDIVQDLQLTEQQITQIEKNFLEHRLKLIDLKYDVERQEALLQPLIEADRPDEAKVSAQIDLVLAARGKLEKENAMMMLSIRRVLSVEQWKKLEAIQQGRERMRMKQSGPMQPEMRKRMPGAPPTGTSPPRPPDPAID
ncbi:MAG: periplasmic heavy metal sensor [Acidobacteria bacterium]|nr:periplasmic heavy metal sensor [Acidobacteriota bacterium]MCL5287054.1 periplasmic heavy metal sensor [Acidobacteriota bacterium]